MRFSSGCLKDSVEEVAEGSQRGSKGNGPQECTPVGNGEILVDEETTHGSGKKPEQDRTDAAKDNRNDSGLADRFP